MINELNLETIREILYGKLGSTSYIAGVIKKVVESNSVNTFAISKAQTLYYNPEFLKTKIKSEEDLFTVLMHEIFHPLFAHFNIEGDEISNIAQDAFINAALFHMFKFETNQCNLMQNLYKTTGVEALLRPFSKLSNTRYEAVYNLLYNSYNSVSSSEIMEILEQSITKQKIQLLGNHGEDLPDDNEDDDFNLVKEKVAEEILGSMGKAPGTSSSMVNALKEVLNIHLTLKNDILRKFSVKRMFDSFLEKNESKKITRSPFPLNPSRTDLFMILMGYDVIFYNNVNYDEIPDQAGQINVYLDVSGSVEPELDKILGLMRNIRSKINKIFLFSNNCVEAKIEDICKGSIITTYGTSFDCVAESILENKIEKALIFTDGYANLSSNLLRKLKDQNPELMVVLFCKGQLYRGTFETISNVVQLEDVTC